MTHIEYMVAMFLSMATGIISGFGFGWIYGEIRHDRDERARIMSEQKRSQP